MKKLFLCLLLIGCTKSQELNLVCPMANNLDAALAKLGTTQKSELDKWNNSVFKACKVESVFPSLVKVENNINDLKIDVKNFFIRTNNSLVLTDNALAPKEWVVLDKPELYAAPATSSTLSCGQSSLKANVEVQSAGSRCDILIDGQKIAEADLIPSLGVRLHTSEEKLKNLIASTIPAGQKSTGDGYLALQTNAFTEPLRQSLSNYDIIKPTTSPSEKPTIIFPTREKILNLLKTKFDSRDWDQLSLRFPTGSSFIDMAIGETAGLSPLSMSYAQLIGKSSSELNNLWDGGISRQKKFTYDFTWTGEIPQGGNIADAKYLVVQAQVEFNGIVKDGGVSHVIQLNIKTSSDPFPPQSFRDCAASRYQGLFTVKAQSQSLPSFDEVIQPCRFYLKKDEKVSTVIFKDKALRNLFLQGFKDAAKNPSYDYLGWENFLKEQLAELKIQSNDFLTELDPPAYMWELLKPAQLNTSQILQNLIPTQDNYSLRLAVVQSTSLWALHGKTQASEMLAKLQTIVEHLSKDFPQSVTVIFQSLSNRMAEPDPMMTVEYAVKLDDSFLQKYRNLRQRAMSLGVGSVFTQSEPWFLQQRRNPNFLDDWQDIMNYAQAAHVNAEKIRQRTSRKVSDKDFQTATVSFYQMALNEGWKPLTFANMEKLLVLTIYIPKCTELRDFISRAQCVGIDKFRSSMGGLLFPLQREFYLKMSETLADQLSRWGTDKSNVAGKIATAFYSPLWANCSDNDITVRKIAFDQLMDYFSKVETPSPEKLGDLDAVLKVCR